MKYGIIVCMSVHFKQLSVHFPSAACTLVADLQLYVYTASAGGVLLLENSTSVRSRVQDDESKAETTCLSHERLCSIIDQVKANIMNKRISLMRVLPTCLLQFLCLSAFKNPHFLPVFLGICGLKKSVLKEETLVCLQLDFEVSKIKFTAYFNNCFDSNILRS